MQKKVLKKFWDETEDWYGRVAKASYMFKHLLIREFKGIGIIWTVTEDGEETIRGTETDWGMAIHKAEQTLKALTFGT